MFVYCIENKVNGKKYVGVSRRTPDLRWKEHVAVSRSTTTQRKMAVHHAMSKYGIDQFVLTTIDTATTVSEMMEKERQWIVSLDSKRNGYNNTDGGEGTYGVTQEVRDKMRQSHLGVPLSETHRNGISSALKGKPKSPEHIKSAGLAHRGMRHTEKTKRRLSEATTANRTGTHHSEKTKGLMSAASKGKPKSAVHCASLSAATRGRKRVLRDDGSFYYVYPNKESHANESIR